MAERFPTPQERAMQWLLEATEIGGMSRPETALHAYQSGFLRREEYDGSEWWEYEPPFRGPETQKPFRLVKLTYFADSLEDINYPMEATEE